MREVAIVGAGMTRFGKHPDKSLLDLMLEASMVAMVDTKAVERRFDALYIGNMASGELCGLENTATLLADQLGLLPCAADRTENSTASGASAIKNAYAGIASGLADLVLVVGAEKMCHLPTSEVTKVLASMAHSTGEADHGVTLTSLAAMLTKFYMEKYGLTRKQLAMVAVKNHRNGMRNPFAQFRKAISIEDVIGSRLVSDPLRLYDCCPITDGAAALVLCSLDLAKEFTEKPILVKGLGQATDKQMFIERKDPLTLSAIKEASSRAFKMAGLTIDDIDLMELHDAFTILEIVESEDIGLFDKGKGGRAVEEGKTEVEGDNPINPSGGLKARGHPVGATGVAQAVEIVWQLRGDADDRQVSEARRGLTCNISGFATNAIVTIYEMG